MRLRRACLIRTRVIGLFSSIARIFSGSGIKKAAQQAAAAQVQAAQLGVDETRRQFDTSRADNLPFLTAGTQALGQQGDLLGLNGGDAQGGAIEALKKSPLFASLFNTGLEATTQNAAATGGLRGGNAQRSFANFGRDTLAQVILQQLGSLGQVAGQGQQTGSFLGELGANAGANLSNLFGQQGQARAGGILGAQAGRNQMISGFGQIGDQIAGGNNPIAKFLKSIGI